VTAVVIAANAGMGVVNTGLPVIFVTFCRAS